MEHEVASPPSLAVVVRQLRLRRGLSVRRLAHAAGIPPTTLQSIEEGRARQPHVQAVTGLARALSADSVGLLALAGYCAEPGPVEALHDALWAVVTRLGSQWHDKSAWISTLIGNALAASRRPGGATIRLEEIPHLLLTDADWATVERGTVPKELAQATRLPEGAGLWRLPSAWLWSLAAAAGLAPTPAFFIAGRLRPTVASWAGVDWTILMAAWDAARQPHPPYLDVQRFLELSRRPEPAPERPTLTPRAGGGWSITIPAEYDERAVLLAYGELLKIKGRN